MHQINAQLVQAAMNDKAVGPAIVSLLNTYAEGLPKPEHIPFAFAISEELVAEHFVGGVLPQVGDQLSLQVYDCQPITANDETGKEVAAHGVKARYLVIAPCGTPRHQLPVEPADEAPVDAAPKAEAKPKAERKPRAVKGSK